MGREIRRVPLDFDWPLNKVWDGFLNPHYRECPHCKAGYSRAYDIVAKHLNSLMWDREAVADPVVAQITTFLAGRAPRGICGHDSINAWAAVERLGKLAGLPAEWVLCAHCKGEGIDPAIKAAYDAWIETPPPTGPGYQLWETVSEGSPISPVFATVAEFITYLTSEGYSRTAAQRFIDAGWAPSIIVEHGIVYDDINTYDAPAMSK